MKRTIDHSNKMKHDCKSDDELTSPNPQPNTRVLMPMSSSKRLRAEQGDVVENAITSCRNLDFYREICQIRLELGEDRKVATLLTEVFLSGHELGKREYLGLVSSLFFDYPLLKQNHMTVFEELRLVEIDYCNRDRTLFLDASILLPNSYPPTVCIGQMREMSRGYTEARFRS